MGSGEWGMGSGEWGMGSGEWGRIKLFTPQSPHSISPISPFYLPNLPTPYSPLPTPHLPTPHSLLPTPSSPLSLKFIAKLEDNQNNMISIGNVKR
ncbi:MAG: hypothetical protein DSM106950_19995 [Stigonema ocellatum SAG 48.90 = DSM 106950]|nr:hypothetical protein [Stigonema ocellatum SAG 48.90 = DSM 106950]